MNNQSYTSNKQPQFNSNQFNSNTSQQKSGPKSQRSVNLSANGSIKSNNAVQGSLKGSIISYNSAISKKSQKSLLSMYPQMLSKQPQNLQIHSSQILKQQKLQSNQNKHSQQIKPKKTIKSSWYIDQDFYYSSEFKRNFVKGMISLSINKNIQDITLLLREIAPTIMVRSCDTIVWISAYLIIFKIEYKIRRNKLKQQQILQIIQDNLIQFLLKNKQIKKIRLIKIVIYLLRQLPINKPKIMLWFEDFLRRNKNRLIGIDINKYIDTYTINPVPIDYNKLNKNIIVKNKQKQKDKKKQDKQKQKIQQKSNIHSININTNIQNISYQNNNLQNHNINFNNYQSNQIYSQLYQSNHNQSNNTNKNKPPQDKNQNKQSLIQPQQNNQIQKINQPHHPPQKNKTTTTQLNSIPQPKKPKPPSDKPPNQKTQQPPQPLNQSHPTTDPILESQKQQKASWLYTKLAERLQSPSSYSPNPSRQKIKNTHNYMPKYDYKDISNIQKIQNKNLFDNEKHPKQIQYQNQYSNISQSSNINSSIKNPQKPKPRNPPKKTDETKPLTPINQKQQNNSYQHPITKQKDIPDKKK